jgi:hypothetical protein
MNRTSALCESMQERSTADLSGELAPAERAELAAHLAGCAACAAEAAELAALWQGLAETGEAVPTARMRARLDAVLAEELAAGRAAAAQAPLAFPGGRTAPPVQRRLLALAATLLVGLGLGYLLFGGNRDDVASLRREVGDLHTMVALSLLEKSSVSERLQGVAYSREVGLNRDFGLAQGRGGEASSGANGAPVARGAAEESREPVVAALFTRLLEDPNVNVRLAALEALRPLAARDDRRGEFVAAVARQESPLVALSLIDLLLESGDAAARRDLEQLLDNPHLDPVVRGYLRDRLGRSA